jgi:hypothetical protein
MDKRKLQAMDNELGKDVETFHVVYPHFESEFIKFG